jgi:hypothetical protein
VSLGFPQRIFLFFLLLALLSACGRQEKPVPGDSSWTFQDLRALELPDQDDPELDLIAAYARRSESDLELRFDLLGSPDPYQYDLFLYLDTQPGGGGISPAGHTVGMDWDLLLIYPARGLPRAVTAAGQPAGVRPRILRDGLLDAVTARLSLKELQAAFNTPVQSFTFTAFLARPGVNLPVDSFGPLPVEGPVPSARAPLILAFWDVLPSATPAQSLRRWDGAHTGPYGQRHGLHILLRESSRTGIPLILLDLKHPTKLAALEGLGGLPFVQELAKSEHLTIPDQTYGAQYALERSLDISAQAGQQFGLAKKSETQNRFMFGAYGGTIPGQYKATFARFQDASYIRTWDDIRLIPMPAALEGRDEQAGIEGLSTAARIALLQRALSPNPADLLVLGGQLPRSPWGDSLIAAPAFEFIRGHPWIWVLDGKDLQNFPTVPGTPDCPDLLCMTEKMEGSWVEPPIVREVLAALEAAPDNHFTGLAWHAYLMLTEPTTNSRLRALRSGYLGQIGPLLAAAHWNQSPASVAECSLDLDWDGMPECILASSHTFAVVDPQGGRLLLLGARTKQGPVQVIGQRSQLIVGLGDQLDWRPELGPAGDPQDIPGAFADSPDAWQTYLWEINPNQIAFIHPQNGTRKVYQLTEQGLQFAFESSIPAPMQVPIILLDQHAYQPGWYQSYQTGEAADALSWIWELKNGALVEMHTEGAAIHGSSFADHLPQLLYSEDPNFAYPDSFFLPFPLAVVEIESSRKFILSISVNP